MTDSEKLIKLAEWLDTQQPREGSFAGDEVQRDLRRIAVNLVNVEAQLSSKEQELQDANGMIAAAGRNIFKLNQEIDRLNEYSQGLTEDRDKLRAENERLKEQLDENKKDIEFYMERMGKAAIAIQLQEEMIENKRKRCEDLEAALRGIDSALYIGPDLNDKETLQFYISVCGMVKEEIKKLLSQ